MASSSDVANGDLATHTQFNNLRADVLTVHDHDGSDGNATISATTFNGTAVRTNQITLNDNVKLFLGTSGAESELYSDGTDTHFRAISGGLMLALSSTPPDPDNNVVHIWNGTAGAVTAPTRAELVLEDNSHVGLALLCPDGDSAHIYFGDTSDSDIADITYDHSNNRMGFRTNTAVRMSITSAGNVQIGDTNVRGTTVGTNTLEIFNGTPPAGTLSNGVSLFSDGGELKSMDASGNTPTLLSPHDKQGWWIFDGGSGQTHKRVIVQMEKLMRRLNDEFGGGYIEDIDEGE